MTENTSIVADLHEDKGTKDESLETDLKPNVVTNMFIENFEKLKGKTKKQYLNRQKGHNKSLFET